MPGEGLLVIGELALSFTDSSCISMWVLSSAAFRGCRPDERFTSGLFVAAWTSQ